MLGSASWLVNSQTHVISPHTDTFVLLHMNDIVFFLFYYICQLVPVNLEKLEMVFPFAL